MLEVARQGSDYRICALRGVFIGKKIEPQNRWNFNDFRGSIFVSKRFYLTDDTIQPQVEAGLTVFEDGVPYFVTFQD
jgi:CRISPR/Cas system CSM-associated protein Csm4 (group 5 of RAMP superfamily)